MPEPEARLQSHARDPAEQERAAARFIHPANLLTYLSCAAGVAAITVASAGSTPSAPAALLALGVLADLFDGRFARLFSRPAALQAFGAQIDSLSDAIVFGAAPVLILHLTGATPSGGAALLWWCAACVYVLCALTRLGAYNLLPESTLGFIGLPAPLGALVLATSMVTPDAFRFSGLLLIACGAAMVSPWRIARPRTLRLGLVVVWALAVATAGLLPRAGALVETGQAQPAPLSREATR